MVANIKSHAVSQTSYASYAIANDYSCQLEDGIQHEGVKLTWVGIAFDR